MRAATLLFKPAKQKGRPRRTALFPNVGEPALEFHVGFVADEPHLLDMGLLGDRKHFVDQLVARFRLRLQVKLGNRVHLLRDVEILAQLFLADRRAVPQDLALPAVITTLFLTGSIGGGGCVRLV